MHSLISPSSKIFNREIFLIFILLKAPQDFSLSVFTECDSKINSSDCVSAATIRDIIFPAKLGQKWEILSDRNKTFVGIYYKRLPSMWTIHICRV